MLQKPDPGCTVSYCQLIFNRYVFEEKENASQLMQFFLSSNQLVLLWLSNVQIVCWRIILI